MLGALFLTQSLLKVKHIHGLCAVGIDNRQNAACVIGLAVPIASGYLDGDILTCKCLEPAILIYAGAIQTDIGGTIGQIDVCI